MPDQQMRSITTRYPVDRYLIESSKKFEMVNIIDEDLWTTEPALKPEDEIILRKLHEMLQSTADDLKLLSGELSKFHEPGVQIKTAPTPLDEEFNEKVHIEEIVNAKFHGYKIIDRPPSRVSDYKQRKDIVNNINPTINTQKAKPNNANKPINTAPIVKKPVHRNLQMTRTKVLQIGGNQENTQTEKLNNGKLVNSPAVTYNEYSFKYIEPKPSGSKKVLEVQEMPSINIRSELKEQKVLQLDIIPENIESEKPNAITKNVAVIAVQHEIPKPVPTTVINESQKPIRHVQTTQPKVRLISKMSTYDSSGSTNISSDTQIKLKTQKHLLTSLRSPKSSARFDRKKSNLKSERRTHLNLDEWRNKLNIVYGSTRRSNTNLQNISKTKIKAKTSPKKTNIIQSKTTKSSTLNNAEYIPYSQLTIGGVSINELEKEISEIPNKNKVALSPILDRILSSRENSFSKHSPRKPNTTISQKVLSTSDENLLEEVIDIQRTVSETLSKKVKSTVSSSQPQNDSENSETDVDKVNESYIDDFEDDKSDNSEPSAKQMSPSRHSKESNNSSNVENDSSSGNDDHNEFENEIKSVPTTSKGNIHNVTYTKTPKLAFKNEIDIYEFVHAVDTQDSATQSSVYQKITPQETQTTPRTDGNIQPIHNDLWPSIDPNGRVERMFEIEKELIKKLILEEYGDLLEKNITKPCSSKEIDDKRNVAASQKNTQTSPARVKHVMTSPTRTKTRTTSPFIGLTVDHHTSPLIFTNNEDAAKIDVEEDLASSINLSSPRFSLRLPGTAREVITNIGGESSRRTENKKNTTTRKSFTVTERSPSEVKKSSVEAKKSSVEAKKSSGAGNTKFSERKSGTAEAKSCPRLANNRNLNNTTTSTSTVEADSSDISSLGELKLRRILGRAISDTESVSSISSASSSEQESGIIPLKSEGEMSSRFTKNSKKYNYSKSEGEASIGKK